MNARCFAVGLLAAYMTGVVVGVAGLWIWDVGRVRHPIETVRHRVEEHRHV